MQTALTVSPPDFVNSGNESNNKVVGRFCQFGCFSIYNSFDEHNLLE
jgi:hypothetical protein